MNRLVVHDFACRGHLPQKEMFTKDDFYSLNLQNHSLDKPEKKTLLNGTKFKTLRQILVTVYFFTNNTTFQLSEITFKNQSPSLSLHPCSNQQFISPI